jgi:hypothetical protein
MKPISDPFKNTIAGVKSRANVSMTVRRIQSKLITYGIISEDEERLLREHTDYGKIDQKEPV